MAIPLMNQILQALVVPRTAREATDVICVERTINDGQPPTEYAYSLVRTSMVRMVEARMIEPQDVIGWDDAVNSPGGHAQYAGKFRKIAPAKGEDHILPVETGRLPSLFQRGLMAVMVKPSTANEILDAFNAKNMRCVIYANVFSALVAMCEYGWVENADDVDPEGSRRHRSSIWWLREQCQGRLRLTDLGRERLAQ